MSDELITYVIGQLRGACWEEEAAAVEALVKERGDYAHKLMASNNTYTEMHLEIERLSDKLTKAVAGLRGILKGDDLYPWRIAREVLAELEGK